jgi:ABC-type sugar transport system substrate-binding protein
MAFAALPRVVNALNRSESSMKRRIAAVPFALAAALAVAAPASPAVAQAERPGAAQPPAKNVSPAEIRTFASATKKVEVIRREFQAQMEATDNPQQLAQLEEQADTEMVQAVEAEGLSVDRYNEISRAANADPALRDHIISLVREEQ